MLDDWDFEHLVAAHTSGCYGVAKKNMQELLAKNKPMLEKLAKRNAKKIAKHGKKTVVQKIQVAPPKSTEATFPLTISDTKCNCG